MYDDLEDFTYEENIKYAEIICLGHTKEEIEALEMLVGEMDCD